jgi:hypothetical protein
MDCKTNGRARLRARRLRPWRNMPSLREGAPPCAPSSPVEEHAIVAGGRASVRAVFARGRTCHRRGRARLRARRHRPWEKCHRRGRARLRARRHRPWEKCHRRGRARLRARRLRPWKNMPLSRDGRASLSSVALAKEDARTMRLGEGAPTDLRSGLESHRKLQKMLHAQWQRIFVRTRHYIYWVEGGGGFPIR